MSDGPSGIINPNKYFSECKDVGLWPYFSNSYNNLFAPSQVTESIHAPVRALFPPDRYFSVFCVLGAAEKFYTDDITGAQILQLSGVVRETVGRWKSWS